MDSPKSAKHVEELERRCLLNSVPLGLRPADDIASTAHVASIGEQGGLGTDQIGNRTYLSPPCKTFRLGDANLDGVFNSADLVHVFQAGRFEAAGANWAEGDWNCDGQFDTADLVRVFQSGSFMAAAQHLGQAGVLITEIMYHPASDDPRHEFIELLNVSNNVVQMENWEFTRGIEYVFPSYQLNPNQRFVVAADVEAFNDRYPSVTNVIGGWQGRLSNRGETIELVDAGGRLRNRVDYADQGDWATRTEGELDQGHRGWQWRADHDGDGKSVELINPALPNDFGQNWQSSHLIGGTPGTTNSAFSSDVAPLVLDVRHKPILPSSRDRIEVTTRVVDEIASDLRVTLEYRIDGRSTYNSVLMRKDRRPYDAIDDEHLYSAFIPAQPDLTIVQFHIRAEDAAGNTRIWPIAEPASDGRRPDALFQVIDASAAVTRSPEDQPLTHLIMTEAERIELADIGDGPLDEAQSNAQMNATFIRVDGTGIDVRYNVGIRNRGGASRIGPPNNYRINFAHDDPWRGAVAINLNSQYVHSQVIGSAVYQLAGIPAASAVPVKVLVNGTDLAEPDGPRMFGSYAQLEVINGSFPDKNFPNDRRGNLYRVIAAGTESGDLRYEGPDETAYQDTYSKRTNDDANDWSDLIELTDVLNNTPDDQFLAEVSQVIDVRQWMRFLALDSLLGNREIGLSEGIGDNYWLYRGVEDTRFRLIPHDLDTLMGRARLGQPNRGIFSYTAVAGLERLLTHPETVTTYYQAFLDLIETTYNAEDFFRCSSDCSPVLLTAKRLTK